MTTITAPSMGESIAEATVAQWLKKEGDAVEMDEVIAELETDKVNLEVNAPAAGVLGKIVVPAGGTVKPGDNLGEIMEGAAAPQAEASTSETSSETKQGESGSETQAFPSAAKMAKEQNVDLSTVDGSGKGGRVTKGDVMEAVAAPASSSSAPTSPAVAAPAQTNIQKAQAKQASGDRTEERVPMTRIRKTIASRLKQAQNTAAMLTTYNEIDLHAVGELRKQYKDAFAKQYDVKLGYMSFFTKAVVEALKAWPALNAEIDGEELVYKNYYDIGIAVGSPRGLVVPVVRDADTKSFAEIEGAIADFGARARDGKLMPDELQGATFSITNGGTFGSMLSMPILNYPQVGILGMHAIKDRPVVVNGEIKVRPVMYVALTYDHRIVDGREAVSFLVKVKDALEDPGRLLLGV